MSSEYFSNGGISGGSPKTLEGYHEHALSREKELLIRNIAEDLKKSIGAKGITNTGDIKTVIGSLKRVMPDPKKQKVKTDSKSHNAICNKIGAAINNRYGRAMIDLDSPAGEICESVNGVMESLFSSLNSEFVSASTDMKRIASNITTLKAATDQLFKRMYNNTVEEGTAIEAKQIQQMHEELNKELNRQLAILANIMGTTMDPTTSIIAELNAENEEFSGFVRNLKGQIGSDNFSSKLTFLLTGMHNVAQMANEVNNALKKIGASAADYKKFSTTEPLVDHLYDMWQKKHDSPSASDISDLMAALDIIKKHDYLHSDIAAQITKGGNIYRKGGKNAVKGGSCCGGAYVDVLAGGAKRRKPLGKRIKKQKKTREMLFKDFDRRLKMHYKTIMRVVNVVGPRMGTSVDLDDDLDAFVRALERLGHGGGFSRDDFYLALTGYRTDTTSKEERARFLGQLKVVSRAADRLSSGPQGSYFKSIKDAVDALVKIVEEFKDIYLDSVTKLVASDAKAKSVEGGSADYEGGNLYGEGGNALLVGEASEVAEQAAASADVAADAITTGKAQTQLIELVENLATQLADIKDADEALRLDADAASNIRNMFKRAFPTVSGGNMFKDAASAVMNATSSLTKTATDLVQLNRLETLASETTAMLSSKLGVKFPQTMDALDEISNIVKKLKAEKREVSGGAGLYVQGGADSEDVYGTLRTAGEKMKFFYRTARLRDNMSSAAKEVDAVSSGYPQVVGDAIGALVVAEKEALRDWKRAVDPDGKIPEYNPVRQWINRAPANKNEAVAATKLYGDQVKARCNLYKAVEHVDTVLLEFNKAINNNPDDLRDLNTLLKSVDIIAKFYTERSGDHVARMFHLAHSGAAQQVDSGFTVPNTHEHYYEWLAVPANQGEVVDPLTTEVHPGKFGGATDSNADQLVTASKKVIAGMQAITNIVSVFAKMGDKLGGKSISSSGFMSNKQLLSCLQQYMALSAYTFMHPVSDDLRVPFNNGRPDFKIVFNQAYAGQANYDSMWKTSNNMFVMTIKSMVSKIFTTIGTFGILNRPLEKYSGINTTRLLTGGAASVPEVIPGAVELYIRLPLLAEFYREIFNFDHTRQGQDDTKFITFVPEMNDVWGKFIQIVFEDTKDLGEGAYMDRHVRELIEECNKFYRKHGTVLKVIREFIAEVNRRYGLVMKKDIQKYNEAKRDRYENSVTYDENEKVDFDILGDGNMGLGRGIAPSDRYDTVVDDATKRKPDFEWNEELQVELRRFRDSIDNNIQKHIPSSDTFSFNETIRQYKLHVDTAKDAKAKYAAVAKAMQGVDRLNSADHNVSMMFHESVVAPLATLHSLWATLYDFTLKSQTFDLLNLEKKLEEFARGPVAPPANWVENNPYTKYLNAGYNNTYNPLPSLTATGAFTALAGEILLYQGECGAGADVTWTDLNNERANTNGVDAIVRWGIDRQRMFKDLVQFVWAFGSDMGDLTDVKVSERNLVVDVSELVDQIKTVFNSVKKNLERFREHIDPAIIRRIEGDSSNAVGSVYWIEEHLVTRILKGEQESKYTNDYNGNSLSLSKTLNKLNVTWRQLNRPWKFYASVDAAGGWSLIPEEKDIEVNGDTIQTAYNEHLQDYRQDSYDHPLCELLFWDPRTVDNGANQVHSLVNGNPVSNSVNNWPFHVIPGDTIHGDIDRDTKIIKNLDAQLDSTMHQLVALYDANNLFLPVVPRLYVQFDDNAIANINAKHTPLGATTAEAVVALAAVPGVAVAAWNAAYAAIAAPDIAEITRLETKYVAFWNRRDDLRANSLGDTVGQRNNWYSELANNNNNLMLQQDGPFEAGLLVRMNQLLSRYLHMGWDTSTHKIYKNLIEKFALGTHSRNVINGIAINDVNSAGLVAADANFGVPPEHAPLFGSLCRFMRNSLMKQYKGEHVYRVDSLVDVPIHKKEDLRSGLPLFDKLFKLVTHKAQFLKTISQSVCCYRDVRFVDSYGANLAVMSPDDHSHIATGWHVRGLVPGVANVLFQRGAAGGANVYDTHMDGKHYQANNSIARLYVANDRYEQLSSVDGRAQLVSIADDILNTCGSLCRSITDVHKELADEPLFPEVNESSLVDYQNINKRRPIGILSQLQITLRRRWARGEQGFETEEKYANTNNFMSPFFSSGSDQAKLQYATRLILARTDHEVVMENMPTVDELLERYNGVTTSNLRMDKKEWESSNLAHLKLISHMVDTRHYKSLLDTGSGGATTATIAEYDWRSVYDPRTIWDAQAAANTITRPETRTESKDLGYTFNAKLSQILAITESSDQDATMKLVHESFADKVRTVDSREEARIYNIIDINIAPFNLAMLCQEIPLNNLMNYSYTFDRIVQNALLGQQWDHSADDAVKLMDAHHPSNNSSELMTKLLQHPYTRLDHDNNGVQFAGANINNELLQKFRQIMSGDSSLDLGRPKYLGDQLWNKSLLMSLYDVNDVGYPDDDEKQPRITNYRANRNVVRNNRPHRLAYLKPSTDHHGNEVKDLGPIPALVNRTRNRFDTLIVRNLIFTAQVQRIARMFMRDEVSYLESPVVTDSAVLSRHVTEFINNEMFDSTSFHPKPRGRR